MGPVIISAAAGVIALVDWKKVAKSLANEAVSKGAKGLLERLKPDEREKAAKCAVQFFVEEFLAELEDKTPLTSAVPGYRDQLRRLIESAAPDISGWLHPETKDVDLAPIERMWGGLGFDPLPEGFDWTLVSKNYARDIRKIVKSDPVLRGMLDTALLEEQKQLQQKSVEFLGRMAGPDPGFDLTRYRDYLRKKCSLLQLSALHTSIYDRRINLWNVFVPQSARESAPVRKFPPELLRRLHQEGHITRENCDAESSRLVSFDSRCDALIDDVILAVGARPPDPVLHGAGEILNPLDPKTRKLWQRLLPGPLRTDRDCFEGKTLRPKD